jgi:hypothetical protein
MTSSVIKMTPEDVQAAAPPHPPCFPDRTEWLSYLSDCHRFGEKHVSRPFGKTGLFRPAFNFCGDCTPEHARGKKLQGKCKPETFRGIQIKEVACN